MKILPQAVSTPMREALKRWFAARAPKSDSATLNLRNVYIFFSREGLLFGVLLLITFVAGINYGNNLVLGLCFYLVSVWLISFHLTFAHLSGLQVKLIDVTMAEVGAPVWVTLQLRSESRQPRRQLLFSFEQPDNEREKLPKSDRQEDSECAADEVMVSHSGTKKSKRARGASQHLLVPRLQGEQTIRLAVMTNRRGAFELPRLQIKTVYPLGIMRAWSYVYFARMAWVYPKPLSFDWQAQYLAVSSEDLPTGGQYTQGQDDFERLDTYIKGESLARVSWAHVARGQGMFTKHFADPVGHEQTLDYADMPAAHHEQKLQQLAHGVIVLGQLNVPFQMQLPHEKRSQTPIGQGESFAQACLLRLAKTP